MPGRNYKADNSYRYGFNGKENDNEVKGEGNQQDYGMRIYDPRLGKFLSVDPITNKYPELTPYQFASNTPIQAVDIDGKEAFFINVQGEFQAIFVGGEVTAGIAFDKTGFAFYGGIGGKVGIGLSATATINGGVFPTMPGIENMKGEGVATNYSGGLILDGGVSYIKSGDYSGISYGAGIGAGAQITESVNYTWMSSKYEWGNILKLRPGKDEVNPFPVPIVGLLTNRTGTKTAEDAARRLILSAKPLLFNYIKTRKNEIDNTITNNLKIISSLNQKIEEYDKKKEPSTMDKIARYALFIGTKAKEAENEELKKEKDNLDILQSKIKEIPK